MDTIEQPGIPSRTIDNLEGVWADIAELCSDLTEAQWKQPSELPGWSVQDVLSHIIGTERLLEGLPPDEPCAPADHVRNAIGELNEAAVAARRSRPGSEVLAEWDELRAQRARTLATADANYFAQPTMTPTGPGTVSDFLDIRILDCWIHEQDIRRVLGFPGNLDGPAAEHTVDRLIRTIPMVVGKRAACPEGGAVQIRITDGIDRSLICEVNGGRAAFVDHPRNEPLVAITFGTEVFAVLATGRASGPASPEQLLIEGDQRLGRAIVDNLNMMI